MRFCVTLLLVAWPLLGQQSCPDVDVVGSPINFVNEYFASLLYIVNPVNQNNEVNLIAYNETPSEGARVLTMIFSLNNLAANSRTYIGLMASVPPAGVAVGARRISKYIQSTDLADVNRLLGTSLDANAAGNLCGDLRLRFIDYFLKRNYIAGFIGRDIDYFTTLVMNTSRTTRDDSAGSTGLLPRVTVISGSDTAALGSNSAVSSDDQILQALQSAGTADASDSLGFSNVELTSGPRVRTTTTQTSRTSRSQSSQSGSSVSEQELLQMLERMNSQPVPSQQDMNQILSATTGTPTVITIPINSRVTSAPADSSTVVRNITTTVTSVLSPTDQKALADFLTLNFDYNIATGKRNNGRPIADDEFKIIYDLIMEILTAPVGTDYQIILDRYFNLIRMSNLRLSTSLSTNTSVSNVDSSSSSSIPGYVPYVSPSLDFNITTRNVTTVTSTNDSKSSTARTDTNPKDLGLPTYGQFPSAAATSTSYFSSTNTSSSSAAAIPPPAPVIPPPKPTPQFPFETVFNSISKRTASSFSTGGTTLTPAAPTPAPAPAPAPTATAFFTPATTTVTTGSVVRPTVFLYQTSFGPNAPLPVTYSNQQFGAFQNNRRVITAQPTAFTTTVPTAGFQAAPTGTTVIARSPQLELQRLNIPAQLPSSSSTLVNSGTTFSVFPSSATNFNSAGRPGSFGVPVGSFTTARPAVAIGSFTTGTPVGSFTTGTPIAGFTTSGTPVGSFTTGTPVAIGNRVAGSIPMGSFTTTQVNGGVFGPAVGTTVSS